MPIHFNIIRDGSLFSARGDDDGIKFEVGKQVHVSPEHRVGQRQLDFGKASSTTTRRILKMPFRSGQTSSRRPLP